MLATYLRCLRLRCVSSVLNHACWTALAYPAVDPAAHRSVADDSLMFAIFRCLTLLQLLGRSIHPGWLML